MRPIGSGASRVGVSAVMVGRDDELRRLRQLVNAAQPSVAILAGEPGIGKSRLVQELIAGLPPGVPVLIGQADPGALSRPFELLLDAVDGDAAAGDAVDRSAIGGSATEGSAVGRSAIEGPAGDGGPGDRALLETVADAGRGMVERLRAGLEVVRRLTASGPAVVVFDDLHWADSESVALFERIADLPGGRLLIGTYRPDAVTRRHPVAELLSRIERRHTVTHLRLERLTLADTSAFLKSATGKVPSYRAAVALHNRTGGNPFFLEELLKAGGNDLEQLCDQPLPWNLAEALRRQIDDLDADATRIVEAAAVLGRKVPFDLLAAVTESTEDDLIASLRDLVGRGLMVETGEDEFSFRHALTREALVDQLLGRQRRRLHGLALETLLATGSDDHALVAHHARGAGRYVEMIDAARRGNARYLAIGSPYQALQLAEMGLDELPDDVELLAGATRAAWLAGLLDDADQHGRRWLAAASTADQRAEALCTLIRVAWECGRVAEMTALTDRLHELMDELSDGVIRAHAMAAIAQSHMLRDNTDSAVVWADRAMGVADELDLPAVGLAGKVEKGSALANGPHTLDEGVKILAEVADEAEAAGEWLIAARAINNLLNAYFVPASPEEMAAMLERMRTAAERAGFDALAVAAYFQGRARLAMQEGDFDAAISAVDEARRRDRGLLRTSHGTDYHGIFLAGLCLEAGDLDRAEQIVRGLTEGSGKAKINTKTSVPGLVFNVACRRGDVERATTALVDVVAAIEAATGVPGDYLHDLMSAGIACGVPIASMRPLLAWLDTVFVDEAWTSLVTAQLDEAAGDADAARAGYLDAADSLQLPPAVRGTAHVGAARCLIAAGRLDEAREHVSRADRLLARWRGWRVDEVAALRGRVGLPTPSAEAAGDASTLTPREREVATLLAEGVTNAELARRLYISPRTAAVHVSNILSKLGLSSRTQVADWLRQRH